MKVFRAAAVTVLTLMAGVTAGCNGDDSPTLGQVTGRVTFQGKPIETGRIVFEDKAQSVAVTAPLEQDGTYVFRMAHGAGLPPGSYQVAVQPPVVLPTPGTPVPNKKTAFPEVPEKYLGTATSGLTATVKEGENRFDFDLK